MPLINLTDISPQQIGRVLQEFTMKELAGLFSRGEILEASVSEKLGPQKAVIMLKDHQVVADTEVPLKAGEKISVRVEQLQPRITLRIIDNNAPEAAQYKQNEQIKEYVRFQRTNPESLVKMVTDSHEALRPVVSDAALKPMIKTDIANILKLLDSVVYSKTSVANNDFIREMVSNLGLDTEGSLLKMIRESGKEASVKPELKEPAFKGGKAEIAALKEFPETLKGQLMQLSQEVAAIIEREEKIDQGSLQKLARVLEFANSSVKTLESQQVVNVALKDGDGTYMLQIPILFPDGFRTGELYIEKDNDPESKEKEEGRYRVVFFLDMDAMGRIMIDASMGKNRIGFTIKCERESVRDFIMSRIAELTDRLAAQGYQIDYMACRVERDIEKEQKQYILQQSVYSQDAINLFV